MTRLPVDAVRGSRHYNGMLATPHSNDKSTDSSGEAQRQAQLLCIEEGDVLRVKSWPGCYWYQRKANGEYTLRCFILGGSGFGSATAEQIAQRLWRDHRNRNPRQYLRKLGWLDVDSLFAGYEQKGLEG